MTREEAISIITKERDEDIFGGWTPYRKRIHEAFTLAIEALEGVCFDEWCDDCKEYDTEKNCCPRFNRVIRGAMKREPSEDGTLEVKVEDATKVGRVLISDDEHRGGLYYPDEYEPKGDDLISRAEAAEMFEAMLKTVTDQKIKIGISRSWQQIKDLPSADRPRGEWIETAQDYYETVNKKGGGVNENTEFFADDIACPNCLAKFSNIDNETERFDFCPNCGADMRGDTK